MLRFTPRETHFSTFAVVERSREQTMLPHTHEDHEINVVLSGSGRYLLDGRRPIGLSAGRILAIPGGHRHRLEVQERLTISGLLVHPQAFRALTRNSPADPVAARLRTLRNPLPPRVVIAPHLYQTFLELFGQSQLEHAREDGWRNESLAHIGRLAAVNLARLMRADEHAALDATEQRVLNVKAWMDRHFAEPATLAELARRAHLSPSHFSALFQRTVGQAPKAYLIQRRLAQAANLLTQTGLSILEIALSAGFSHLAHFNRSFKSRYGRTPGAYRKKAQKNR